MPIDGSQVRKPCWIAVLLAKDVISLVLLIRVKDIHHEGCVVKVIIVGGAEMYEDLTRVVVKNVAGHRAGKVCRENGFEEDL